MVAKTSIEVVNFYQVLGGSDDEPVFTISASWDNFWGKHAIPLIDEVIFNPPYTIINWRDGTKTKVRLGEGEEWNEEVGLSMAIIRKLFPTRNYFKKLLESARRQYKEDESNVDVRIDLELAKRLDVFTGSAKPLS